MTVPRQRIAARVLLAVFVAASIAWLWSIDRDRKISTNILDLIPATDRQPELMLVRSLASQRMGRVVLFAVNAGTGASSQVDDAVKAFAASLRQSGCFDDVAVMNDPSMKEDTAKAIFNERLNLLFPSWLAQQESAYRAAGSPGPLGTWVADRAASHLEHFLAKPEALAFQDLLPSDPLLLMPGLVDHLHAPATVFGAAAKATGLVWALQKANPLLEAGQQPVFAAIEQAEQAMRAQSPSATLRWTGVARFAAQSRTRIEKEFTWLNLASLLLIAGVASSCLSRAVKALNLVPPVLCGLLGAWVVTTLSFDRVHILVFVIGSLLGGVAIDYGFYLYLQPPLYPGEPYSGKVKRLLKPLLASALTTVLGFTLLLASDLPLIRQLGVFVSAGLLCALGSAILWFGQLRSFHLPARAFASWRPRQSATTRRLALAGVFMGLVLALAGPWLLTWRDNIRQLEIPSPGLHKNDLEVRSLFGEGAETTVYLTRGTTAAGARDAWTRFSDWYTQHDQESSLFSVAALMPTPAEWRALPGGLKDLGDFEGALRIALVRHGFDAASFAPFFDAWHQWTLATHPDYGTLVNAFAQNLRGPTSLLLSLAPGACWYASIAPRVGPVDLPENLDTLNTSQLETLNRVFGQYRESAMHLSIIGLSLVGLSVFALYGLRRGLRVFAIPVGACLCSLGVLGIAGQPLNLFHLLGAFLGVCLSHNYAIFSTENALRGEGVPPSIRLSGITTSLSFGVLAFSHIPVVSALGTTVSLQVVFALLIVELGAYIPGGPSTHKAPPAP